MISIACSPNNPDILFAAIGGGTYQYSGNAWILQGILSFGIYDIVPLQPDVLLAASLDGVYELSPVGL